jgi:hypothetical protein
VISVREVCEVISAAWKYTELREKVGGRSVITFRQKLRPKVSHLS